MESVVIAGAARTPIGDYLGSLKDISAVDLGVIAAKAALKMGGIAPDQVEDVVAGMVYKAGAKGNPARQIQLKLGIPVEVVTCTVDQQCASAMRALEIVVQQIMLGKYSVGLAVGIESMSQVPYILKGARSGGRIGEAKLEDGLLHDALIDAFCDYHMGVTAENLAEIYKISRAEQDEWALVSHQRAVAAIEKGTFKDELVPVEIKSRKGSIVVERDEHPRADLTAEKLAAIPTAFKKNGTITAGNASPVNDGAAAVLLMSESRAKELGIKPLGRLLAQASYGVKPEIMGIGPVYAIPKALSYACLKMDDIGCFEINEAFAAQFLAVNRELKINKEKLNVNGSGIALGHPVGSTGLRIIVSLLYEMRRSGVRFGIASLCAGGGPAMATVVEVTE